MTKQIKVGVYALCLAIFKANQKDQEIELDFVSYSSFKSELRTLVATSPCLIGYLTEEVSIKILSTPSLLSKEMAESDFVTFDSESNTLRLNEDGFKLAKKFERDYEFSKATFEKLSVEKVTEMLEQAGIPVGEVKQIPMVRRDQFISSFNTPNFQLLSSVSGERMVIVFGLGAFSISNIMDLKYQDVKALMNVVEEVEVSNIDESVAHV